MSSWRFIALSTAAAGLAAVMLAWRAGTWILLLPTVSAALVLAGAAVAVDYFGLVRRREGWGGCADDPRASSLRARAFARQFRTLKAQGSPRTARAARSLLLALADCDRLREAGEVADFLSADAVFARVGDDPIGDALRAVALAELGRRDEARKLAGRLLASRRCGRQPVVRYAWARVAELDGRAPQALEQIALALARRCPAPLRRDLHLLRARCLVRLGRTQQAADALRALCAEGRGRDVERVMETARATGEAALAQAARHALSDASPYR